MSKYVIEENEKLLTLEIVRSQGSIGKITVDLVTLPNTATFSIDKSRVVLSHLDKSEAISTAGWCQVNLGDEIYIVVLTSLPSETQLYSMSNAFSSSNAGQSVLYRWQGELSFVQVNFQFFVWLYDCFAFFLYFLFFFCDCGRGGYRGEDWVPVIYFNLNCLLCYPYIIFEQNTN